MQRDPQRNGNKEHDRTSLTHVRTSTKLKHPQCCVAESAKKLEFIADEIENDVITKKNS